MLSNAGKQNLPPKIGQFWHEDYFKLKAIKTQQVQEKLFTSPISGLNLLWKGACIRKRDYQRQ